MRANETKLKIYLGLSLRNCFYTYLRYIQQEATSGSSIDKNQILSVSQYRINHSLLNIHGLIFCNLTKQKEGQYKK